MTAPPDCDPTWRDQPHPSDNPPPAGLLRLQELADLRDQRIGPIAFRNSITITASQDYL